MSIARRALLIALLLHPVAGPGGRAVRASTGVDAARAAWREACRSLPSPRLPEAATRFRNAALDAARTGRLSPEARLAALVETDGLLAGEARRRARAFLAHPGGAEWAALRDSLSHHLTSDPIQRIVDFRDTRYSVLADPFPSMNYRAAFTFSLWIRLDGAVGVAETKVLSHAGVAEGKCTVLLGPGEILDVLVGLEGGSYARVRAVDPIPIGNWVHLAVVFDRERGAGVFAGGRPLALETVGKAHRRGTGVRSLPAQALCIGGPDRIFPGWIDDIRLYDRALAADEVVRLAAGSPVERGLVGHWPLDDAGEEAANLARPEMPGRIGPLVVRGEPGVPGLGEGLCFRFSRSREAWSRRVEDLERRIAERESALLAVVPPPAGEAPSVAALRDRLEEEGAALVYYVADPRNDRLAAWVVAPGASAPVTHRLPGSLTEATRRVAALRACIEDPGADRTGPEGKAAETRFRASARELAALIWDPVAGSIPDGAEVQLRLPPALHAAPFAALVDTAGRWLNDRYAFSRAGPLNGGTRPHRPDPPHTVVAFGNPAYGGYPGFPIDPLWREGPVSGAGRRGPGSSPCFVPGRELHGTRRELDLLRQVGEDAGGPAVIVREWQAACEESLRAVAGAADVLHFATHGYRIDPDCLGPGGAGPLFRVGLQMAGVARTRPDSDRARDDGLLSADELSRLRLGDAGLVVFSGCATANGDPIGEDGPVGLPLAAWIAGAGRSLATLWDVSDDTMPDDIAAFYRAWLAGGSPARALRHARLAARSRTLDALGHAHPRHWAAMVLEGS